MIPRGVEVFVGIDPIDLRWSFDKLAGIVEERIGRDARCGALFIFFGKRRTALKVFFFYAGGLCQYYKRLDKGTFRVPEPTGTRGTAIVIDERTLDDLLDGIEVEARAPKRSPRPVLH